MKIEELGKFFSSLDNPVKLRIIDLISREGSQSLTDVRNKLKVSFSTAFKYLNQMQDSGVLKSRREVKGGREKILYSLSEFDLNLSSKGISEIISEKKNGPESFTILDFEGRVRELNLQSLSKMISDDRSAVLVKDFKNDFGERGAKKTCRTG